MKKKIIYLCIYLSAGLWWGCGDFLEEYAQNSSYIESVDDLDELMLGECYLQLDDNSLQVLDLLADESQERVVPGNVTLNENSVYALNRGLFAYMENPFTKLNGDVYGDSFWASAYKRIAVLNSILQTAGDVKTGNAAEQERLKRIQGECLYLRAWNYFLLANLYGLPYDKTNPNDGGCVTLKTGAAVVDTKFGRDDAAVVYGQVVTDLTDAVSLLEEGETASSKRHVTPAACWALLNRVYLYMEEYDKAVAAADRVEGFELWNLTTLYTPGSGESFLTTGCPELIFAQGTSSDLHEGTGYEYVEEEYVFFPSFQIIKVNKVTEWGDSYGVSEEVAELFGDTDVRFSAFFTRSWRKAYLMNRKYRGPLAVADEGYESEVETDPVTGEAVEGSANGDPVCGAASIRYAEVVLNKAEALACNGREGDARVLIGDFCSTRYTKQPVIPSDRDALIRFIRQERQKELCYEGHRWFDLRRYAVNTVCQQTTQIRHILHTVEGNKPAVASAEVSLAPWSEAVKGAWILPVPEDVTDYCYPNFSNFDRLSGVTLREYQTDANE